MNIVERTAGDVDRIIEECLSRGAPAALLDARSLPAGFFDLRSGVAGAMLQKLRNYRVRLAVVCPPDMPLSDRFAELAAEERRKRCFALFPSRSAAREWLTQNGLSSADGP
jgi:hypothetical protein